MVLEGRHDLLAVAGGDRLGLIPGEQIERIRDRCEIFPVLVDDQDPPPHHPLSRSRADSPGLRLTAVCSLPIHERRTQ